jgi:hypothetical protein
MRSKKENSEKDASGGFVAPSRSTARSSESAHRVGTHHERMRLAAFPLQELVRGNDYVLKCNVPLR